MATSVEIVYFPNYLGYDGLYWWLKQKCQDPFKLYPNVSAKDGNYHPAIHARGEDIVIVESDRTPGFLYHIPPLFRDKYPNAGVFRNWMAYVSLKDASVINEFIRKD